MYWKVRDILLYFLFDVCGNCIRNYTEIKQRKNWRERFFRQNFLQKYPRRILPRDRIFLGVQHFLELHWELLWQSSSSGACQVHAYTFPCRRKFVENFSIESITMSANKNWRAAFLCHRKQKPNRAIEMSRFFAIDSSKT